MARHKRTSERRNSTTRAHLARMYAHTSSTSRNRRHQRRVHLQEDNDMRRDQKDSLEDMYRSLLSGENGAGDDESGSSNGSDMDDTSEESEWDEETTLVEMLGTPGYNEGEILNALRQAFADSAHDIREEMVLVLIPALNIGRNARPAPGREFITGLLGFDDVCKRFETDIYRSAEFDAAYAQIEEDIRDLFEQLQVAYTQLEERRIAFQQEVKERTKKMREIMSTLPAEVEAIIANLHKTYINPSKDRGGVVKGKGRERTIEGALAELQLQPRRGGRKSE